MTKEIAYQGYSAVPSDYENPDGQLAASLNLIHEDGALHPVAQPTDLAVLPVKSDETTPQDIECSVVFIHKTSKYTHYIVARKAQYTPIVGGGEYDGYGLYWFDGSVITNATSLPVTINDYTSQQDPKLQYITLLTPSLPIPYQTLTNGPSIYSVEAIGNTLVVLTSEYMTYILWTGTEYKNLGTHLPELPLSFGLKGEYTETSGFVDITETQQGEPDDNETKDLNLVDVDLATNQILANVNAFISEIQSPTLSGEYAKFVFPFFVRYAYRLYDGSLTMHSSPVLMTTCSSIVPLVSQLTYVSMVDFLQRWSYKLGALAFELDYICPDELAKETLQEWSDIIQSVDVFISAPIYQYDQSGKIQQWAKKLNTTFGYTISKVTSAGQYNANYAHQYVIPGSEQQIFHFILPHFTDEQIKEKIRSCSTFYLLESISVNNIATYQDPEQPSDNDRYVFNVPNDYLSSLTTREVMTDDYDSHDNLIARQAFVYNDRLSVANIEKQLASPNNILSYVPYQDGGSEDGYTIYFYIRQEQKEFIVSSPSITVKGLYIPEYLYYNNPNTYKAVIVSKSGGTVHLSYSLPLTRHDFLNGAVFFDGWESQGTVQPEPTASNDTTIKYPNKIYTSDVNNPFYFPVTGINTVGSGTILAMSAATKALSQGQFGQFPMYAFTTDGVWALEVSATGGFSARQPITRDVCISPESITQLDSSVLFATERGIMLVQGSDTVCISDALFSEHPFDVLDLPHASVLHTMLGHNTDTCLPTKPFIGFLSGCQMLYDYVHQHIIVFNPSKTVREGVTTYDYTYAYVYSLKSKEWGMMYTNVKSGVNAYPEAMAMTHDGHLVSFAHDDADKDYKGLFITRPIKLGNPDVLKSIHTVIQRGMCQRGDVNTVLWGSRDLYNWYLIGSSTDNAIRNLRGTPYKYFRIGGVATLPDGKSLFGVSVEAEPRHTSVMQ